MLLISMRNYLVLHWNSIVHTSVIDWTNRAKINANGHMMQRAMKKEKRREKQAKSLWLMKQIHEKHAPYAAYAERKTANTWMQVERELLEPRNQKYKN